MVVEREPPKTAKLSSQKPNQLAFGTYQQPEFGKPSPIRNRMQSSVFNIPKPQQGRPEHHRVALDASSRLQETNDAAHKFVNPFEPRQLSKQGTTPDLVEIPKPANHPAWAAPRPAQPLFSSYASDPVGFSAVNSKFKDKLGNFIDLTSSANNFSQVNMYYEDRFAAADPYTYVDAEKATENIKALLEGAFEDEEDKPRTRGRKKKIDATVSDLTDEMKTLVVEKESENQNNVNDRTIDEEGDDDDDDDDGTIEGLNVKLLPHQVNGVAWMIEKEIGAEKKKKGLPKGGILADDVSLIKPQM